MEIDMEFYVHHSCENERETGRTKLTLSDFDTKSVRDVKYAIQDAIQAPVCDQKLFYQGQPLTDDNMLLSRLYFREGDCFHVQFLAVADIPGISELLDVLKVAAQEIVESLQRELPSIEDNSSGLWRFYDRLVYAVEGLASFFFPWKSLRSVAQRHYFVQEGGFDAFLEVLKFSRQLYLVEHPEDVTDSGNLFEDTVILDQLKHHFNQGQLVLQLCCLSFLWNFAETPEDRKFVLSKGVLPLTIDALLLHPRPLEDTYNIEISSMIVGVNETAIGCCGGLVESDATTQEEVSKMTPLIDKILFMIDRRQSEPAEYSLFSSQVASNTLFYCTFNVKSAQPLVDCGALTKMIDITRHLLLDKEGNTPLRYYCCLFLARMRSAPLIRLDKDTCVVIDVLIDTFLEKHVPCEISQWEEETSFVWMTMVPLVHLAFAAGKESCNDNEIVDSNHGNCSHGYNNHGYQNQDAKCKILQSHGESFLGIKHSTSTMTKVEGASLLSCEELAQRIMWKCKELEAHLAAGHALSSDSNTGHDASKTNDASASQTGDYETVQPGANFTWPGSKSTQKLGIFSLVHMLSIKENQQLALSENLVPFLVCLSWQLNCKDKEKFSASLANSQIVSPPSLKIAAKSVLACCNGLDMVFSL